MSSKTKQTQFSGTMVLSGIAALFAFFAWGVFYTSPTGLLLAAILFAIWAIYEQVREIKRSLQK